MNKEPQRDEGGTKETKEDVERRSKGYSILAKLYFTFRQITQKLGFHII